MSKTKTETLTADGSTPWIPLGQWENRVEVRAPSFSTPNTTSAKLEFSTDATASKLTTLETLTAADAFDIDGPGSVRLTVTGVNTSIDLLVTPKARP